MRAFAAAAFSVLLGAAPPVGAQQSASVHESAEVALVEVPVRVVGRDGNPVRGLTASDFAVEDDGRPRAIVGFDAIDLTEKLPGVAGPAGPAARRRFLILFDFSFSQPRAIVAARRAAKELVLSGMGDRDLAAVATYSVEQGVRVAVTFTPDREQLVHAIDTLGLEAPRERSDPLAFLYLQAAGPTTPGIPTTRPTGGKADQSGLVESLQSLSIIHRMRDDEYARGRVRQLFQSFRELTQTLDVVEGRKDIIYLSEGFSARFLTGTADTDEDRQSLVHGELWKVDSDKRFGSTPLRGELGQLGELFRRSDCVVHAVDIAGLRADTDADGGDASLGPRESENALFEFAQATGGEVFRNANDFGAELAQIVKQTSLVYVLAFRPEQPAEEGRFHQLKVRVSTPGVRVIARAGYYDRRGFRQLSPLERRLLAADVIANEIPFDQVPARVLAVPFAGSDGTASVPVLLEVPGPALLEADRGEKLQVELYAYAFDDAGRLRDFFVHTLATDLTRNRDRLMAGGLRYFGELHLPPGSYRLRTLVRNATTGRMGSSAEALDVPVFAESEPFLLRPLFLDPSVEWVAVAPEERGAAAPS
ncbi:MAG TPA: VWA domain-containing protein, partial [Thermoanaerobaculia bacterium]|nr:VWA domain-containing protein [Thermoanaerobaculia bacterium]